MRYRSAGIIGLKILFNTKNFRILHLNCNLIQRNRVQCGITVKDQVCRVQY